MATCDLTCLSHITIYYQLYKVTSVSFTCDCTDRARSFPLLLFHGQVLQWKYLQFKFLIFFNLLTFNKQVLNLSREVNHTCSVLWLAVRCWCHTFMCTCSINSGSASWYPQSQIGMVWFCQLKIYPITLNLLIYNHGTCSWFLLLLCTSHSKCLEKN